MGFEGIPWSFWFVMLAFVSFGCECFEKAGKKVQGLFGDGGWKGWSKYEDQLFPSRFDLLYMTG